MQQIMVENQFQYRFAWYDPQRDEYQYGAYLFDNPAQARDTYLALKETFPTLDIWLEDRAGRRVEIPR